MSMSMRVRVLTVLIPLVLLCFRGTAAADNVDRLMAQLERSRDYKLRLSAAINLGKLGDQRAVSALIGGLSDSNENVRGACAASLATLVDGRTDKGQRQRALRQLKRLAESDRADFVRKQAARAYARIREQGAASPKSGGIYIDIGGMSSKAPDAPPKLKALMRRTAEQTFSKRASSMTTSWPTGGDPTAKQLRESKTAGYHVDGTLVALETESKGGTTLISCKVSMLVATYPEKSMFGFLDGGARVQTGSSPRDIQYAQEDCVTAVVEDLVARKIIPVIQKRH